MIYSDCTVSLLSHVDRLTDQCVVFREERFEMVCVCTEYCLFIQHAIRLIEFSVYLYQVISEEWKAVLMS